MRPGPLRVAGDLVHLVLAGGYPEAIARRRWTRRQDWYANYVEAVVERDVCDIANRVRGSPGSRAALEPLGLKRLA